MIYIGLYLLVGMALAGYGRFVVEKKPVNVMVIFFAITIWPILLFTILIDKMMEWKI